MPSPNLVAHPSELAYLSEIQTSFPFVAPVIFAGGEIIR